MFVFSERLELDHCASVVWPYLTAFERVPLWEHGLVEVRQLTPGAPGVGTEILARRIYLGRETQLTGRIVEFVDERSATMSLQGGPIGEALVEYAVEPIDDGRSVVAYRAQGQLIRPLRFLEPIMPEIGRAEARRNLVGLQRRIDGGIPAGAAVTRGMPTSASDKGGHP